MKCNICGRELPRRKWWQLPRDTCRDFTACSKRFSLLFGAGVIWFDNDMKRFRRKEWP